MSKENNFKKELAELMKKYNVEMYIEIEQDYAGVQGAELAFDTEDVSGTKIFSGWNKISAKDIEG